MFCESSLIGFRGSEAISGFESFSKYSFRELLALLVYVALLSIVIFCIVNIESEKDSESVLLSQFQENINVVVSFDGIKSKQQIRNPLLRQLVNKLYLNNMPHN